MDIKIGDKIFLKNQYGEPTLIIVVAIDKFGRYECKTGHGMYKLDREFIEDNVVNKKVKYMNFIEAVKLLKFDKNIKLKKRDSNTFSLKQGTSGLIHLDETYDKNYPYAPSSYAPSINHILAEDWYVVKAEKLHTFEEALKAYKSGKNIRRKDHDMMQHDYYCSFDRDDVMANDWIIIDKEDK
jgi:hypothetical protein